MSRSDSVQPDLPAVANAPAASTTATPLHPFYSLPAELIVEILDRLTPDSFLIFAFANYPLLATHGMAPVMSPARIRYIQTRTSIVASNFPLLTLPPELTLNIMGFLGAADLMRFAVANYQLLVQQNIAPPLTEEMIRALSEGGG